MDATSLTSRTGAAMEVSRRPRSERKLADWNPMCEPIVVAPLLDVDQRVRFVGVDAEVGSKRFRIELCADPDPRERLERVLDPTRCGGQANQQLHHARPISISFATAVARARKRELVLLQPQSVAMSARARRRPDTKRRLPYAGDSTIGRSSRVA